MDYKPVDFSLVNRIVRRYKTEYNVFAISTDIYTLIEDCAVSAVRESQNHSDWTYKDIYAEMIRLLELNNMKNSKREHNSADFYLMVIKDKITLIATNGNHWCVIPYDDKGRVVGFEIFPEGNAVNTADNYKEIAEHIADGVRRGHFFSAFDYFNGNTSSVINEYSIADYKGKTPDEIIEAEKEKGNGDIVLHLVDIDLPNDEYSQWYDKNILFLADTSMDAGA